MIDFVPDNNTKDFKGKYVKINELYSKLLSLIDKKLLCVIIPKKQ